MMKTDIRSITKKDAGRLFPKLPERANKGMMGRLLVICGSYDPAGLSMSGAAYFCAKAAYRCGVGIVEIFTHRSNYPALAGLVPEAVFSLYGADEEREAVSARVAEAVKRSDAVVIGCGLGQSEMAVSILRTVLSVADQPLLIDADGLNILSKSDSFWGLMGEEQKKRTVITPHPGEMSRLCGFSVDEILASPRTVAEAYAKERGVICLLKDHRTVITDGEIGYANHSGNPGMATAGMGDILAGVIGALLARAPKGDHDAILLRTAAGAYLHGRAGDRAKKAVGEYSLIASDLLSQIEVSIRKDFR